MKIQTVSKVCAAVVCALSFTTHAANDISAQSLVGDYTGTSINRMMGLTGMDNLRVSNEVTLENGITKYASSNTTGTFRYTVAPLPPPELT